MAIQDFYTKLTDQERKVFYIAISALILAFFDLLFLRPVLSRLSEIDENIHATSNAIERDIRFISYRDKIFAEDEAFRIYQTDDAKTGEEIIAGFLKTVEMLARKKNIVLSRITPADIVVKKGFVQYFANLECSGKLDDMIAFMYSIDSTENLLKIVRMNMAGNKASKEEVTVDMKIAKLVIDPATIGNYEFKSDENKVSTRVLREAASAIGLPGENISEDRGSGSFSGEESGEFESTESEEIRVQNFSKSGASSSQTEAGEIVGEKSDGSLKSNIAEKTAKGGRARIDSIDVLWRNFIGKFFGSKKDQSLDDDEFEDETPVADYDVDERNLWERKAVRR